MATAGGPLPSLHVQTPLVAAPDHVAQSLGVSKVLYKLDNLQPSGSFKIRGIGYMLAKAAAAAAATVSTSEAAASQTERLEAVSSSGGNAGLATAWVARTLGLACRVFTPSTTPDKTIQRLQAFGASVVVVGKVWDEAHAAANAHCKEREAAGMPTVLVHPFDHPDLWTGHSSVVHETIEQAKALMGPNERLDAFVCSVGGGGLLCVETEGAASFAAAVKSNKPVSIGAITSIAKSLGALTVTEATLSLRHQYGEDRVVSAIVSDADAVMAPACGAAIAAVLQGSAADAIRAAGSLKLSRESSVVVVEVCGGSNVSVKAFDQWRKDFGL
ncbi:L-serine dehydratase/L-threonine deaminase-like protein [Zopfochytrium polystomum]|nr:L-serine dehydratase/L-threonine deaminase-like protein [Zopfochytrium polystomum]